MDIPAEIRVRIYDYVLPQREKFFLRCRSVHYNTKKNEPAILRVSKLLRQEAMPAYLRSNYFHIHFTLEETAAVAKHLETMVSEFGTNPFAGIQFIITKATWTKLNRIFPLVEFLRATKANISTFPRTVTSQDRYTSGVYTSPVRLVKTTTILLDDLMAFIAEAVEMGANAKEQGWDGELLKSEFSKWLKEKKATPLAKRALKAAKGKKAWAKYAAPRI